MNILNKLFIFTAGAAIGSAVTWKLVKTKYEQIANEEIESVKETFSRGHRADVNPIDESDDEENFEMSEENIAKLKETIESNGYRNYSIKKESEVNENMNKPYVISPDEFDENDYEVETLNYYQDGVLTDLQDNIIEDVESMVGEDSLNHFGEYEDDSVFVRNEERGIEYEILLNDNNYSDLFPTEEE